MAIVRIDADPSATTLRVEINAARRQIGAAGRRAARRTATWLRGEMAAELATAHDVPLRVIRRRLKVSGARGRVPGSVLWAGILPVRARDIGKLWPRSSRQQRAARGSWAGEHFFPGAFVARLGSVRSVWRRKGRERFPVSEEKVELTEARPIAERQLVRAEAYFQRVLQHELDYRLRQRGLAPSGG